MIHVHQARQRLMEAVRRLPAEQVPLLHALGRYTAMPVAAPYDHPLFACSAMDGYAFAFADGVHEWTVVAELAAGDAPGAPLAKGECARIFTGAMLPAGADTVVMQELVQRTGKVIGHSDAKLRRGSNVRARGDQLRAGDTALGKGALVDAGAIGLLASVGVQALSVGSLPRVGLLISGNEFAGEGEPAPGKIFGSNGVMLQAALREAGVEASVKEVRDEHDALLAAWRELAAGNDLVLSTGGVSVGDHDLIPAVLRDLGAAIHFHGVLQKPGKPMLFGQLGHASLFGLPGNPRAVMVLFLEYVLPFLRAMQGAAEPWLRSDRLPISGAVKVKGVRAEFRAARVKHGQVELLADEGSHMLRSMVEADALAYIPAEVRQLEQGDLVEVHYLK